MSQEMWRVIWDWVPFVIFLGLLLYVMSKMRPQTNEMRNYRTEHLAEMRRQTEQLERIARALEQRPPA